MTLTCKTAGIFALTFAVVLCLTFCSYPHKLVVKKTSEHCHQEQDQKDEGDVQKICCSPNAIIPVSLDVVSPSNSVQQFIDAVDKLSERDSPFVRLQDSTADLSPPRIIVMRV